jgi:hypothetical protein
MFGLLFAKRYSMPLSPEPRSDSSRETLACLTRSPAAVIVSEDVQQPPDPRLIVEAAAAMTSSRIVPQLARCIEPADPNIALQLIATFCGSTLSAVA